MPRIMKRFDAIHRASAAAHNFDRLRPRCPICLHPPVISHRSRAEAIGTVNKGILRQLARPPLLRPGCVRDFAMRVKREDNYESAYNRRSPAK